MVCLETNRAMYFLFRFLELKGLFSTNSEFPLTGAKDWSLALWRVLYCAKILFVALIQSFRDPKEDVDNLAASSKGNLSRKDEIRSFGLISAQLFGVQ
jgi:hypothetical protein